MFMPTVQVTADLPTEALLQAIEQLDEQDLNTLLKRMLVLRARRRAGGPQTTEAELLQTSTAVCLLKYSRATRT
jgi:hypothetical protein